MIEMNGLPAFDGMTRGTVCAQASPVWIIGLVTGKTVLFRCLQLGNRLRAKVTS
jgi:hypothetical protein